MPNLKNMNLRDKSLSKYKNHMSNEKWKSYKQLRNYITVAVRSEQKVYLNRNNNLNKYASRKLEIN